MEYMSEELIVVMVGELQDELDSKIDGVLSKFMLLEHSMTDKEVLEWMNNNVRPLLELLSEDNVGGDDWEFKMLSFIGGLKWVCRDCINKEVSKLVLELEQIVELFNLAYDVVEIYL